MGALQRKRAVSAHVTQPRPSFIKTNHARGHPRQKGAASMDGHGREGQLKQLPSEETGVILATIAQRDPGRLPSLHPPHQNQLPETKDAERS